MIFSFMDNNKNIFSIGRMAKVLKVSRNGYYKWKKRPVSNREIENERLLKKIKKIYEKSKGRYGSPRIRKKLLLNGHICGKNRVERLMRNNNIHSKRSKKFKVTTDSNHKNPIFQNILDRNFIVDSPNKAWVSDITYIHTKKGWLYLCVVIDLFSRKVVGWSMNKRINKELVINAFMMAYLKRKPSEGLIFHSDRGSQYCSNTFKNMLQEKKVIGSMSRKGNCWDNAVAESFFKTLKVEEVYQKSYNNREEARMSIFEYIEVFYNRQRLHSTLNYLSPEDFELKNSA